MLNYIELIDFRSHARTRIDLGPVNIWLGPNGAGKTSAIDALCWVLAGANHNTDRRGTGIASQARLGGAGAVTVRVDVDKWGTIERSKEGKALSIAIPGSLNGTVAGNEALLLQRLGVPKETLLAMLDAKPLLSREPADQRDILLRVLRPPEITPTPMLTNAGINAINGIEHMDSLIHAWKNERLRDLNRDRKKYEAQKLARPEWPVKKDGKEVPEEDIKKLFAEVSAKRDKLLSDMGFVKAVIKADEDRLDEAEKPAPEGALSYDEIHEIQKTIANLDSQIHMWTLDLGSYQEELPGRIAQAATDKQALSELRTTLERLKSLDFQPHCETCKCPIEEQRQHNLQEIALTEAAIADRQAMHEALSKDIAALKEHVQGLSVALDGKRSEREILQGRLRKHEAAKAAQAAIERQEPRENTERRLADSRERCAKFAQDLETLDRRLAAGKSYLEQIDAWRVELKQQEGIAKTYMDLIAPDGPIAKTEAVIRELQRLRDEIMKKGIGPFLNTMQAVLDKFNMPGLAYHLERGFLFNDTEARLFLSRGQSAMFFELAFRHAVAEHTGIPLVVIDHDAPVDEANKRAFQKALLGFGHQVILTWTIGEEEKPKSPAPAGVKRYWFSQTGKGTEVEQV